MDSLLDLYENERGPFLILDFHSFLSLHTIDIIKLISGKESAIFFLPVSRFMVTHHFIRSKRCGNWYLHLSAF